MKMAGRRKRGSLASVFNFVAKLEQFLMAPSPSCLKQKDKKDTVGRGTTMQIMRNLS